MSCRVSSCTSNSVAIDGCQWLPSSPERSQKLFLTAPTLLIAIYISLTEYWKHTANISLTEHGVYNTDASCKNSRWKKWCGLSSIIKLTCHSHIADQVSILKSKSGEGAKKRKILSIIFLCFRIRSWLWLQNTAAKYWPNLQCVNRVRLNISVHRQGLFCFNDQYNALWWPWHVYRITGVETTQTN